MEIEWTASQSAALDRIIGWARGGPFSARGGPFSAREFRLGGLAGTGKTFLTGFIARTLISEGVRVELCAPTGRAASILTEKSKDTGIVARTVHSILKYGPGSVDHEEGCDLSSSCTCEASGTFRKADETDYTRGESVVVIVDEASMLTRWMYEELMGLGAKILFVGDYGQLPPVGESGFSIVEESRLDAKLTDIVRQEAGNPIIELAMEVRKGRLWTPRNIETEKGSVRVLQKALPSTKIGYAEGRFVLCYTNRTRVRRNNEIRERRWGSRLPAPVPGDLVICLRNDPERGVFNGQRGVVEKVSPYNDDPNLGMLWATMENGSTYIGPVVRAQFGNATGLANEHGGLFDYGYAITTHKAQGSEADDVIVLGESLYRMPEEDQRKWRYTAVTRAKKSLTVIVPA